MTKLDQIAQEFDKKFGDCKLGTTSERDRAHQREIKSFFLDHFRALVEEMKDEMRMANGNRTFLHDDGSRCCLSGALAIITKYSI